MGKVKATKPKTAKVLQAKATQVKSSTAKISTSKKSIAKISTPKIRVAKQKTSAAKTSSKPNTSTKSKTTLPKLVVGSLELCSLPELGLSDLQIRVDTGAKTSSLHVNNIKRFNKNGKPWVSFDLHPDVHHVEKVVSRDCAIHDVRKIKSSNGVVEERYLIKTLFNIGGRSWPIEITLSDRSDMNNLMLLGRQGMRSRILVDPSKKFLMSKLHE